MKFKNISKLTQLATALCIALILPQLMMDGMFMDGEMYTAVAHNLSLGKGTWWMPYYTDHFHGLNTFHENPPGGTWPLALFFKLFGSSILVERFYVLCTLLTSAILIRTTWLSFVPQYKKYWWLPFFLFVIIPTVHWGYRHNLMENTMLIFVLLSVWSFKKAVLQCGVNYGWFILSALFTWFAFMTKGPAGLFTLVTIPAMWVVWRPFAFKKMLILQVAFTVVVLGGIAILFILPVSAQSMDNYFFVRTMQRINKLPTVSSRFWILGEWLRQILVPVFVSLFAKLLSRKAFYKPGNENKKAIFFFLIMGILGSAPLMLTTVQRGFYLITSLPFFTIALALWVVPNIQALENTISAKASKIISITTLFLLAATIATTAFLWRQPKRDKNLLADAQIIANTIGINQSIRSTQLATFEWGLKAYLMRKYQIQFSDQEKKGTQTYLLAKQGEAINETVYCKVDLNLREFELYKKCE